MLQSDAHNSLGTMEVLLGRTNEAALAVAREIGNRQLEGNIRCNLGLLHQVQGRYAEALEQLDEALAVARDLGHARLEGIALCNLGMVYDNLARFDEARDHFAAALAVARELGDRRLVLSRTRDTGNIRVSPGRRVSIASACAYENPS